MADGTKAGGFRRRAAGGKAVMPAGSAKGLPSRLALWWLAVVDKRLVLVHLLSSIVVFVLLSLLAQAVIPEGESRSFVREFGLEILIIIVSLALPLSVTILCLRRPIGTLRRVLATAAKTGQPPILRFFDDTLGDFEKTLEEMRHQGAELERHQIANWVQSCFEFAMGPYVGTAAEVPSKYGQLYIDYLDAHRKYLKRTGRVGGVTPADSTRIVLVDIDQLRIDKADNPEPFNRFIRWHHENKVELKRIDRARACALAQRHELPAMDVGVWEGQYALMFQDRSQASESPKVALNIAFEGDHQYSDWRQYINLDDSRVGSVWSARLL